MNMAKRKKPKLWVSIICMVLFAAVLVACAVTPGVVGQLEDQNSDSSTSTFTASKNDGSELIGPHMDGPVSAGLGDFMFTLPEGMSMQSSAVVHTGNAWDYGYELYVGGTTVGGVALRYQKQFSSPNSFSQEWQAEIGVPEAMGDFLGHIGSGSKYADYEVTYSPDMFVNHDDNGNTIPNEQETYVPEHEVTHYFYVNGTDVYDLWFYINLVPNKLREVLLQSCYIEGVTDIVVKQDALDAEEGALEQCRNVLEQIQSSGAYRIEINQENGAFALNDTTIITSLGYGDNRLNISIIPEGGGSSWFGCLLVDGERYECDPVEGWRETTRWEWRDPWMVSFQWDESVVTYMDTMKSENGITVMLRIDQPFAEGEDQQPHYFVNFNYDADGTFRNAYVQTNLFMNNEISKTESIMSLNPEEVNAEIQKEYQKATG